MVMYTISWDDLGAISNINYLHGTWCVSRPSIVLRKSWSRESNLPEFTALMLTKGGDNYNCYRSSHDIH